MSKRSNKWTYSHYSLGVSARASRGSARVRDLGLHIFLLMIMAEQAETTFVKTYLNAIINQPITYGNDYQQPLQNSLKRIPILPVRMHTLCRSFRPQRIMGL